METTSPQCRPERACAEMVRLNLRVQEAGDWERIQRNGTIVYRGAHTQILSSILCYSLFPAGLGRACVKAYAMGGNDGQVQERENHVSLPGCAVYFTQKINR